MCGICGFFNPKQINSKINSAKLLKSMTDSITHRGPDGDGFFINKQVALGMRRLAIIDLQTGDQPQFNEDNQIVVVFNGEIYNFKEIREQLKRNGHTFLTQSDTEIITHLYEDEGDNFVHQLNGMFAIALFDQRKQKLLLVRDRLGIKPLHYAQVEDSIVFGSELKCLLKYPGINKVLSEHSLYNYFTFECVSAPRSIFKNIHKLMPGEMQIFEKSGHKQVKYWQPQMEKTDYKENDLIEKIRDTFISSVKYRLISDVPLGVFLSGGVDSTLITGIASSLKANLKTFSIGFCEETFNELPYAKIASTYFNTEHHEMVLSYKKAIELLPTIMDFLDEPLADASIIPTYLVSYLSRPEITVALSGDGGDELFLGYDTYKAYKYAKYSRWIPKPLTQLIAQASSLLPASSKRLSLEFKIKKFISGLKYKPEIANYIWWGAYAPDQKKRIFSQDFLNQLTGYTEFEPISAFDSQLKMIKDPLDRVNFLDLHLYLQDDLLPKVDRMSMATSLEVRVPFLDHRMVELATSIKNNKKLKGLSTKHILKKALQDYIPPDLMKRPKIGFDIPLGPWLKNELKDYMLSLLERGKLKNSGIFNIPEVERIISEHLQGRHNHRQLLWPLIIFQHWFDKYKPQLPF